MDVTNGFAFCLPTLQRLNPGWTGAIAGWTLDVSGSLADLHLLCFPALLPRPRLLDVSLSIRSLTVRVSMVDLDRAHRSRRYDRLLRQFLAAYPNCDHCHVHRLLLAVRRLLYSRRN